MKPRYLQTFTVGSLVLAHDKMQKDYVYELVEPIGEEFDPRFRPELTPQQMLEMGVFEGKYCTDCRAEFPIEWFERARFYQEYKDNSNYFPVKARSRLSEWKANGWINEVDPRGWFQWYMRYYLGRRISVYDEMQIKRWRAFVRHKGQIQAHCASRDLKCHTRQRQALLQWAYDPCF